MSLLNKLIKKTTKHEIILPDDSAASIKVSSKGDNKTKLVLTLDKALGDIDLHIIIGGHPMKIIHNGAKYCSSNSAIDDEDDKDYFKIGFKATKHF